MSFVFIMEPSYWTCWLKSLAIICVDGTLAGLSLSCQQSVFYFYYYCLNAYGGPPSEFCECVFYQTRIIQYYTCTVHITYSLHCWSPSYVWKVTSFFNGVWPYHWFQWNQGGGLLQMQMNRARLTRDFLQSTFPVSFHS